MKNLADPTVRESIQDRIAQLQPSDKANWGRMRSHQMLVHLTDSFRAAIGEKPVSPATGVLRRTLMKWGALYVPAPWPKEVPTRPEVEQGVGGTALAGYEQDRAELAALIERFCVHTDPWYPHPIFGAMKTSEWMRWGYLHADHHLRQFA